MKLPLNVETIIFDVDGTLYDQRRFRMVMIRSLAGHCLANPVEGYRAARFLRAFRQAQEHLRSADADPDLALRQVMLACGNTVIELPEGREIVKRFFETTLLLYLRRFVRSGLLEVLNLASTSKIGLGVFSDYPAEEKLRAMSLYEHFDAIVSSCDAAVGRFKPHPAGLELCLARLSANPANTLYVGDRGDVDSECAQRANVCPVIVGSRAQSDLFISIKSFKELGEALRRSSSVA